MTRSSISDSPNPDPHGGRVSVDSWLDSRLHRAYLQEQAMGLWRFYSYRAIDSQGGFFDLDAEGSPRDTGERSLVATTRMIHCYSIAYAAGIPAAKEMVAHGLAHMNDLWDEQRGGWFWSRDEAGPVDPRKLNYGHAFAILAGASATDAGIAGGRQLLDRALAIHDRYFWDEDAGAAADEYLPDWSTQMPYRGQNGNMHLCEAYLAAAGATGDPMYVDRARRIAELIIRTSAQASGWRVPEHYSQSWEPDYDFGRDAEFDVWKPFGATVGHGFEWSRLLLQVWNASGRRDEWLRTASRGLFERAWTDGWDAERGGLVFTTDWQGQTMNADRYHWVLAEAISAAAALLVACEHDDATESRYRELWGFTDRYLIDHQLGGWFHQLDNHNQVTADPWFGKPDIYHALTACLLPVLGPLEPLLTRAVR